MTLRVWNSTLARRTPLRNGKPLKRTVKIRKSNPARQARHDAEYRRKLAVGKRGAGYREAMERAGGRCEYRGPALRTPGERDDLCVCEATEGLEAHHLTYRRMGHELASDFLIVCQRHHALLESAHPTRRHGRIRGIA